MTAPNVQRRWNRERASKAVIRKWRDLLITEKSACVICSSKATDVGHLIPMMCFLESGLRADISYFEENLIPVCRRCNQVWVDWDSPRSIEDKWGVIKTNHWLIKLEEAVLNAHEKKLWVYLSPNHKYRKGYPGPVVLAPPKKRDGLYLEVVGYRIFHYGENEPHYHWYPDWRMPRYRLLDLVGDNQELIQKSFVLTQRANELLKEWAQNSEPQEVAITSELNKNKNTGDDSVRNDGVKVTRR